MVDNFSRPTLITFKAVRKLTKKTKSLEYRKCPETGKTAKSFEYGKCLETGKL